MVDEQLTADLSWTSGGGEKVFVGPGPPEDEKTSLNEYDKHSIRTSDFILAWIARFGFGKQNKLTWTSELYLCGLVFFPAGSCKQRQEHVTEPNSVVPHQPKSTRSIRSAYSTLPSSPGSSDVPDQPVVSHHSSHFDRVGEAPVSWHERRLTAVQWQNGLLGQQVIEANCSLLLCDH